MLNQRTPNIGLQRTSACGLAAEAGSFGGPITAGRIKKGVSVRVRLEIARRFGCLLVIGCLAAGRLVASPPPIPGTFHVVCGAAVKDNALSAIAGAPIVFEADAAGGGFTYSWGFSDGASEVGPQATHVFSTGGRQGVTLAVVDPQGHHAGSGQTIQALGLGSEPNAIVIAGAGFTGTWDTEVVLGNPFDSDLPVVVFTRRLSSQYGGCMIGVCPPPQPALLTLSPNSQRIVHYSELFPPDLTGLYLSSAPDDALSRLPVVRARSFATNDPSRAMELPIVTYETLVSRPLSPLGFVGGQKSATSHSNLFLAETSSLVGNGTIVQIEAIDSAGNIVGSIVRSLDAGRSAVVFDVIGSMGIADFEGQVRVTQLGGTGVVDGALATLTEDGGFAVSAGIVP